MRPLLAEDVPELVSPISDVQVESTHPKYGNFSAVIVFLPFPGTTILFDRMNGDPDHAIRTSVVRDIWLEGTRTVVAKTRNNLYKITEIK